MHLNFPLYYKKKKIENVANKGLHGKGKNSVKVMSLVKIEPKSFHHHSYYCAVFDRFLK